VAWLTGGRRVSHQMADTARTCGYWSCIETVNGDGRGGLQVEVDTRIEEVGGLVGEIDWREGGFTPNGGYCPYSLNVAFACTAGSRSVYFHWIVQLFSCHVQ